MQFGIVSNRTTTVDNSVLVLGLRLGCEGDVMIHVLTPGHYHVGVEKLVHNFRMRNVRDGAYVGQFQSKPEGRLARSGDAVIVGRCHQPD